MNWSTREKKRPALDSISTEEVLTLHERAFGPLDARSRERILAAARMLGWDRDWADSAEFAA